MATQKTVPDVRRSSRKFEALEKRAEDSVHGGRGTPGPSAFVFYHYFPPDEVVSAIHFGELSAGLAGRGWHVEAFPCVWGCRDDLARYASGEEWQGVAVRRVWRPRLRQSSGVGRILNAIWLVASWSLLAFHPRSKPDVLIIGTDPILSILVALVWKAVRPRTAIAHWCFDLYPEAACAEGLLREGGGALRVLQFVLRAAYRRCSLIADIGPCMRRRLERYPSKARRETLVPWAIDEPEIPLTPDEPHRHSIFGEADLALLYSGSFGLAHSSDEILALAESLSSTGVKVAFSVGGNRQAELREEVRRRNLDIPFAPFAKTSELRARLACADVHLVTLRKDWTGIVVPSKFFGALSAGRPILFAGSPDSAVAQWIREFGIGWNLEAGKVLEVKELLLEYAHSQTLQAEMQIRCHSVYQKYFSRSSQIARWDSSLRELVPSAAPARAPE